MPLEIVFLRPQRWSRPKTLLSCVKITGFCKMPLFIFVVFARFQALTAKFI